LAGNGCTSQAVIASDGLDEVHGSWNGMWFVIVPDSLDEVHGAWEGIDYKMVHGAWGGIDYEMVHGAWGELIDWSKIESQNFLL
jgi:hypothetical protein